MVFLKANDINENLYLDSALGAECVYDFRERQGFIYLFCKSLATLGQDVVWQLCLEYLRVPNDRN